MNEASKHRFHDVRFTYNVMKFITGHALTTEEAMDRYLKHLEEAYIGNYFVEEKSSLKTIGIAKIGEGDGEQIEIGYCLFEEYWGKGFASEVAQMLIEIVKEKIRPDAIFGTVDSRNGASVRILEKVGMEKEKEWKEGNKTICRYLMTIAK